jgi:hypothetical protein
VGSCTESTALAQLQSSSFGNNYNYRFSKQATKEDTVMTDPALAPSKHSDQPRYYRDRATAIRARLPTLQDDEVFTELYLLAYYYERSAELAESSGSLGGFFRR